MARSIKEAWDDYKRHYQKGFEIVSKKEIVVYDGAQSKTKVGVIAKGDGVHVKPIKGGNY